MVRFHWTDGLCLFVGVSLLAAGVHPAAAQGAAKRSGLPSEVQGQLGVWQKDCEAVVAELKEDTPKSNKHARKRAYTLFEDVVDYAVRGEEFLEPAGRILIMLAIAEVRLGDRDAGAWHWQMAQNVSQELRNFAFDDFPDVALFMLDNVIPEKRWEEIPGLPGVAPFMREDLTPETVGGNLQELPDPTPFMKENPIREILREDLGNYCNTNIVPPKLKTKVQPRYPARLVRYGFVGDTVVRVIIDKQGSVRQPVVVRRSGYVSLDLAVLEALRGWTFEPATCLGKPVAFDLKLSQSSKVGQAVWRTAA